MLGLKPIKMLPARERVAAALRKGDYLKTDYRRRSVNSGNTAQELGVSITPVREAFRF